jgi:hypothetical protein
MIGMNYTLSPVYGTEGRCCGQVECRTLFQHINADPRVDWVMVQTVKGSDFPY